MYCYWYHTGMNIIMEGPKLDESSELEKLINELDDSSELFTVSAEQYFI